MRRWLCIVGCFLGITFATSGQVIAQPATFVELEVDNRRPYVGEPVNYIIRFFQANELENIQFQQPIFQGFGLSTLSPIVNETTVTRSSTLYTMTAQQFTLYPLQAGTKTIPPFVITVPETPFQPGGRYQTDSAAIDVQSLPPDAPSDFTNAVGQFTLDATLSPEIVTTGESATLIVSVTGSGNLDQLLPPPIEFPSTWQIVEEAPTYQRESPIFGTKQFRWTLIPLQTNTLPSINFSFFNPQTTIYQTQRTAPLTLTVTGSAGTVPSATPTPTPTGETTPPTTGILPLPIKRQFSQTPAAPPDWFWLLWIVPPILAAGLWLMRRSTRVTISLPVITSNQYSRALQNARQSLEMTTTLPPNEAYMQIGQIILTYLSQRSGREITYDNAGEALQTLPPNIRRAVQICLTNAARGQYAPLSAADVALLLKRTRAVLNAVDKRWSSS